MTGLLSVAGSTPSADEGFELKSVRLDVPSDPYLTKQFVTSGNRKTWTMSFWCKPKGIATVENQHIVKTKPDGNEQVQLNINSSSFLYAYLETGNAHTNLQTTQVFRDPASWYHIVWAVDTTQETAANRSKVYVNGEQITSFTTATYPPQNAQFPWNQASTNQDLFNSREDSWNRSFDGYIAEFYSIDGSALTPASFGATNEDTNQWQPTNPYNRKTSSHIWNEWLLSAVL